MLAISQGGVDTCLQVIKAYEKDPAFKKALEDLKKATAGKKRTDSEVAEQEQRLHEAAEKARREQLTASQQIKRAASAESTLAEREAELEFARRAFDEDMQAKQNALAVAEKRLQAETERLQKLDGELKQLKSDLVAREDKLVKERGAFEGWQASVRSAIRAKVA